MRPSHRRYTAIAITAVATAMTLSACGSGGSTAAAPGGQSSAAATGSGSGSGSGSGHPALPSSIQQSGVLRVGTDVPFVPMEMYGADHNTYTGIEPDLMNAIGARLGVKVKFSNGSFDGLIPALNAGRYDVLASSFGNFVEREKVTNMVSFMGAGVAGIVRKADATMYPGTMSLCGTPVGVQNGSATTPIAQAISATCQKDGKAAVKLSVFPSDSAGMVALQSKRINVMFDDRVVAQHLAATQASTYGVVLPGLAIKFDYSFVVAKNDVKLAKAIAWSVDRLIADGTYAKIMHKYGITGASTLLTKASINSGTASESAM